MMNGLVCCYFDVLVCGGLSLVEVFCRGLSVGQVCSRVRTKLPPPILAGCEMIGAFDKRDPN